MRTESEWREFEAAALRRAVETSRENPAVSRARALAGAGDLAGAAAALAALPEPQLAMMTLGISAEAARRGLGPDAQQPLFDQLDRRLPAGTEAGRIDEAVPESLLSRWLEAADGFVAPATIVQVLRRFQGGAVALSRLAVARAAAGRLDEARLAAERIPELDKEERALALAHIALAERRAGLPWDETALRAARVAHAPPRIQEGGEEAEALGEVIAAFAEGDVPLDHPAVEHALAALEKLAETYVRKDQRSYGVRRAIVGAARRAAVDAN